MVLKTLEMQGFKSFPDKTQLNFGKGITAVVGPNGSGKSNISDAVRWVLGETSSKSLRGSKMEDVIFGGTSNRKPLGFAQVVLTLDNSDGTLKNKGELVSVTRRYYRSGESEYKIDGENVRRKDIHELFMDTGLGADGYSMVGQGKIDSIISAKNEERREIFEEAAGISRFRHKRRDAERRLDQASENLVRLLDILKELERRVGPLKTQSEKAKKYLEYSAEKKTLDIGVWLNKINRFTSEIREQEHKIDSTKSSYEICENDLKEIDDKIDELSLKISEITVEIDNKRSDISQTEEEIVRKNGEIDLLNANFEYKNETITRLKNEISISSSTNSSIDEQILQKQTEIENAENSVNLKKTELENILVEREKLQTENEGFSKKSVELNQNLTSLTIKLSDLKVEESKATSSIDEINARQETIDEKIQLCQSQIDEFIFERDECDKNLEFAQTVITENENALSGYQLKLDAKTDVLNKAQNKLDELNRKQYDIETNVNMLTDLEKNMEGFSGAVKAVINQSKSGALTGIHGVLSKLIMVEDEYSVAVETALGAAMQNIVVSNENDGKRAINYLKQNRQGRATFLPISSIKSRSMTETDLDDNYGFVDLASNLVSCENEYKNIVSNLLERVIVVEDIDCAIAISKRYANRYKIVTLDGQVMNVGGSMTGGSGA